jgi:uncharacterized protein (DUF952 family)
MRWLYHVVREGAPPAAPGAEGFVHCSYRGAVAETARLYFPSDAKLEVLRIDPRRVAARVEEATTPRGPMPHVFGEIPRDAIVARLTLSEIETSPDEI